MAWSKLVDMEMSDDDQLDYPWSGPPSQRPRYPCGLIISLTKPELEKLGLKPDCDVGDLIDLRCFASVTSVSLNQTDAGESWRVELQIQKMACEDEMTEPE